MKNFKLFLLGLLVFFLVSASASANFKTSGGFTTDQTETLENLGDVTVTSGTANDILQLNSAGQWVNSGAISLSTGTFDNLTVNGTITADGLIVNFGTGGTVAIDDELKVDIINENTTNSGVTVDGALIKDATVTALSYIIGANTLDTTEWAFLDGLDQALTTISDVIFNNINSSGSTVTGTSTGNIIVATESFSGSVSSDNVNATNLNYGTSTGNLSNVNTRSGSLANIETVNATNISVSSLTGSTIEGATITEGGVDVPNVNDNLGVFAATTSAQLAGVISDETGTGEAVFARTPILVTPNIGAATADSIGIGANILTTFEWGFLDSQNQTVATTSSPTFAGIGIPNGGTIGSGSTTWTFDSSNNDISTTSNVGIGTTTPGQSLVVDGSENAIAWRRKSNPGNLWALSSDTIGSYIANLDTAERVIEFQNDGDVIMRSGNVGIGTSTPSTTLQVKSGASGTGFSVLDSSNNFDFVVTAAGNVGIGVANPVTKLDIEGGTLISSGSANATLVSNQTPVGKLLLSANEAQLAFEDVDGSSGNKVMALRADPNILKFMSMNDTGDGLGSDNILVIHRDGNVGIGTAEPNATFTASGTIAYPPNTLTGASINTADTITVTNGIMRVQGSTGAIIVSSTPSIADGVDGQSVIIQGTSDAEPLTLQDESKLGSSGLQLSSGFNFTLGQGNTLQLIYDGNLDKWFEVSRSDN